MQILRIKFLIKNSVAIRCTSADLATYGKLHQSLQKRAGERVRAQGCQLLRPANLIRLAVYIYWCLIRECGRTGKFSARIACSVLLFCQQRQKQSVRYACKKSVSVCVCLVAKSRRAEKENMQIGDKNNKFLVQKRK